VRFGRNRTRRRGRQTPLAYAALILAAVFLVAAGASWGSERSGSNVARLVVAVLYAAYAVWFWRRARRQDAAADAADPRL
jgi:hypothetical protein